MPNLTENPHCDHLAERLTTQHQALQSPLVSQTPTHTSSSFQQAFLLSADSTTSGNTSWHLKEQHLDTGKRLRRPWYRACMHACLRAWVEIILHCWHGRVRELVRIYTKLICSSFLATLSWCGSSWATQLSGSSRGHPQPLGPTV